MVAKNGKGLKEAEGSEKVSDIEVCRWRQNLIRSSIPGRGASE